VGKIGEVSEERLSLIKDFEKALEFYTIGDIVSGKEIFKRLLEDFQDAPSLTFIERC
jgi:hypothetical protein